MNEEDHNRGPSRERPVLLAGAAFAIGATTILLAYQVHHEFDAAVAWGLAMGALVAGLDPRWFLAPAVVFLLLPPVLLLLGEGARAERVALTAFYFLFLGIALEFRHDLGRRGHSGESDPGP